MLKVLLICKLAKRYVWFSVGTAAASHRCLCGLVWLLKLSDPSVHVTDSQLNLVAVRHPWSYCRCVTEVTLSGWYRSRRLEKGHNVVPVFSTALRSDEIGMLALGWCIALGKLCGGDRLRRPLVAGTHHSGRQLRTYVQNFPGPYLLM
jgi:hypothetical protein